MRDGLETRTSASAAVYLLNFSILYWRSDGLVSKISSAIKCGRSGM